MTGHALIGAAALATLAPGVGSAQNQSAPPLPPSDISIEDMNNRATIAGCLAREAAKRKSPQPREADPKVRAEIARQARDPARVEQCQRVMAED